MPDVFKSITRLVYHSNGGFGFSELYSEVPVYIRRFLVSEIEDIKKREKEAIEGDGSGGGEGIPDDMGQAMEQMQKQKGHDGSQEKVQEDLKEVFGDAIEEERNEPTTPEERMQTPPSQRTPINSGEQERQNIERKPPQKTPKDDQPEPNEKEQPGPDEDQPDPADAEDLEQMINKLKNDM